MRSVAYRSAGSGSLFFGHEDINPPSGEHNASLKSYNPRTIDAFQSFLGPNRLTVKASTLFQRNIRQNLILLLIQLL